jgi:LCP family protein required for cell wall assembly
MTSEARYTRNTRLNPDGSGSLTPDARETPRATWSQSFIEYGLFALFGILLILAAVAIYTTYDPKHRVVPNTFDAGLKQDRINIVFIGIGGDSHPGGGKDLADSVILLSLKPSTKQAAVVSVPRDLWVHMGGYGTHRINYAHAIGNESGYPGEGPGLLCDTVSNVFRQPVNAFVRIDFSAFEKIVDDLGGVDVYCQRGFYDYLFRDGFAQGWHHLDGKRALAYARYRYVIGPEGDNFARELRQQQVINAVRDRMQRINPQAAIHLIQIATTLSNNTETNLTTGQLVTLYRTFHDIQPQQVRHVSLKPFTELFEVTRLGEPGEAVRTRTGDFRELQSVEASIFASENEIVAPDQIQFAAAPTPPPRPASNLE